MMFSFISPYPSYAMFVNASMTICIVTDANNPETKEIFQMIWSDTLYLLDDKMVKVNENTNQPEKQEKRKWVDSHLMIFSHDQGIPEPPPEGFAQN